MNYKAFYQIAGLFSLLLLIVSCGNSPVITEFPCTLTYDSTILLSTRVYNWEREMDTVDESLANFKSIQQIDSIRILNAHTGLRYSHANQNHKTANKDSFTIDSLVVNVYTDSLTIMLVHPPELVVLPDTRGVHNAQVYHDSEHITAKFTKTLFRSGDTFYLNQYAVKLMTPSTNKKGAFGGYTISRLNQINVPYLRENLEANEYLSIFRYCEVYTLTR